jgi:AraC-like DNA-binding protein
MRERSQRFDPRQNMRSNTFEVFHYREPRPNVVEVHHHDFYEVYYLLAGEVEFWVDGKIIRMQPGELLLINPMELHRPVINDANRVYERIVIWINREYLESLDTEQLKLTSCFDTTQPGHPHLIRPPASERPALTARIADLVREFYSKDYGSELCAYGLFLQLMVQLNRMANYAEEVHEEQQQLSPLVQGALLYINEHINQELSLESIAAQFYISKYHLSHAFTREMGISIYRYILMRRLLMARQMLTAGESAGQVCRSCGFADYTSFYRAFKSEYGISPREYASLG